VQQLLLLVGGAFAAFSTLTGINNESVLANVPDFDLIAMAPQDVMHVILEGGLSHETRLFLEHCVAAGYFDVGQLNDSLKTFPYGYAERSNKPSPITLAHLQAPGTSLSHQKGFLFFLFFLFSFFFFLFFFSFRLLFSRKINNTTTCPLGSSSSFFFLFILRFSASQQWLLARIVPLVVRQWVPQNDFRWFVYQQHLKILYAALAPEVHPNTPVQLENHVQQHHLLFRLAYPQVAITPKLHYYVHLPSILRRDGPCRWVCCLRYEAKHQRFSELYMEGNHINPAKTLCQREEFLQTARFAQIPGQRHPDLLSDNQFGTLAVVANADPIQGAILALLGGPLNVLRECRWATVDGTMFRVAQCVVRVPGPQPDYFELTRVITDGAETLFIGTHLDVVAFHVSLHLYQVARTQQPRIVRVTQCCTLHAIMLWNLGNQLLLSDRTSDRSFF